ncbi:MAG: hypothetical protein CL607_16385 [Anaerolineaceae bacterium]|nr:hypothetical protein [Anaerolineaceae bacterium]
MHRGSVRYLQFLAVSILLAICINFIPAATIHAAGPFTCNDTVRIMPTGDSLTQGYSSGVTDNGYQIAYRKTLYDNLIAQGRQINFVGSNSSGGSYTGFDPDHMGMPGWNVQQVEVNIYNWLVANTPDIVLLHIGTNDLNPNPGNPDPALAFIDNYERLLNYIDDYENNTGNNVTVVVARIIRRLNSKTDFNSATTRFNDALESMVNTRISNGDDLILVDMENDAGIIYEYTTSGGDIYYLDAGGIHLAPSGYNKMAGVWGSTLLSMLPDCSVNAPTNISVSNVARTSLTVSWTDTNTHEGAYLVERSVNSGAWSQVASLAPNTQTYNVTNLTCGTNYGYRVRAASGTLSVYSNYATTSASTPACIPTPSAPVLNGVSETTIALALPSNPNNYTLQIQRQDQAQLLTTMAGAGNWVTIASVTNTNTNYVDTPLTCETMYAYRYRWVDGTDAGQYGPSMTISTNPCPAPLTHSFGLYKDGHWIFYTVDGNTAYDARFTFGPTTGGWQAVIGDWNGDGIDGIGVYRQGVWKLHSATASGVNDITFAYGAAEDGWTALLGDWDGNGTATPGLYKNGVFLLRNSNNNGTANINVNFGTATSLPIVGDWDGNGTDTVGYYENGTFTLSNSNVSPAANIVATFGPTGWLPLIGDWDDNNTDTIGIYNDGLWRMRNSNSSGAVQIGFNYGDLSGGWQPMGKFNSDPSILNLLFASTVPTPRVIVIPGPSDSTPPAPNSNGGTINDNPSTEGSAGNFEPEVTPTEGNPSGASATPIGSPTPTLMPEATTTPEATATVEPSPTLTSSPTPIVSATPELSPTPEPQ